MPKEYHSFLHFVVAVYTFLLAVCLAMVLYVIF